MSDQSKFDEKIKKHLTEEAGTAKWAITTDNLYDILDEAKAEIPTRADAKKVLETRLGHKIKHDGFSVGMTACIHAELYGKWVDKWFGASIR